MPRASSGLPLVALAAVAAAGCYAGIEIPAEAGSTPGASTGSAEPADDGASGDSTGPGEPSRPDDPCSVLPPSLRRLTSSQYDNTIGAIFGWSNPDFSSAFVADDRVGPFRSNATQPVSELQVEHYATAAQAVAQRVASELPAHLPCDPQMDGEEQCARAFIADLAFRAFRRPVTEAEVDELMDLFALGRDLDGTFEAGIELVVASILQLPQFLYLPERGEDGAGDVTALDEFEIASRLSYLVWDSMPDEILFDAARHGELANEQQIDAQLRRMLDDPRAQDGIGRFYVEWLGLEQLETAAKDPYLYPEFTPELAAAMREESEQFTLGVTLGDNPTFGALLTADYTVTDDPQLLTLYGVAPGAAEHDLGIALPPEQRSGVLTHASVLSIYAHAAQSSPVHRGIWIRDNLICQTPPPPPPDADITEPAPDPNATTREVFEEHIKDDACKGCHVLFDPIGFALENYDTVGRYRTKQNGLPIDATGWVELIDLDDPLDGGVALANTLAQSKDVQRCFARQWFRFALGRRDAPQSECAVEEVESAFVASGGDVIELLRTLALSDAFRYVTQEEMP